MEGKRQFINGQCVHLDATQDLVDAEYISSRGKCYRIKQDGALWKIHQIGGGVFLMRENKYTTKKQAHEALVSFLKKTKKILREPTWPGHKGYHFFAPRDPK